MELLYDAEITVKINSINLLIRILDYLTDDIKEGTIVKIFLEMMDCTKT